MTDKDNLKSIISRIAANVLGLDSSVLRTDANLFEQGLDSIITIQLVVRLEELGVNIRPRDIFEHQTIDDLARLLNSRMEGDNADHEQTLEDLLREIE
jgi:acyl carrier protein